MTDQRLRDAERRLRQEASVENEATYLRARCAAGTLAPIRLQAAARLDYPPALMALDGTDPPSLRECLVRMGVAHVAALDPNEDEGWVFRAVVALLMVVWDSNRNLAVAFEQAMIVVSGVPQPNLLIERASREFVPWLLGDRLYCLAEAPLP